MGALPEKAWGMGGQWHKDFSCKPLSPCPDPRELEPWIQERKEDPKNKEKRSRIHLFPPLAPRATVRADSWEWKNSELICHCCSVAKLCLTLGDPIDRSTSGCPVLCSLPELAQIHVHESLILSNHLILCRSLLLSLSQHQGLFQGVGSSHQVAKGLELQLRHQPFH